MTKTIDDETQKAFAEGQEAWRHGKSLGQNPYYKGKQEISWSDGWEAEDEANLE